MTEIQHVDTRDRVLKKYVKTVLFQKRNKKSTCLSTFHDRTNNNVEHRFVLKKFQIFFFSNNTDLYNVFLIIILWRAPCYRVWNICAFITARLRWLTTAKKPRARTTISEHLHSMYSMSRLRLFRRDRQPFRARWINDRSSAEVFCCTGDKWMIYLLSP